MATNTINENVEQAILDFGTIKQAIVDKDVEVPDRTPTSQYATKIGEIQSGGTDDFKNVVEGTATEITLPSNTTKIRDYTFYGLNTLELNSLPSGITDIGGNAFNGCTNLALTSLPSSLTTIGQGAFYGCIGLTEITFEGTPTSLNSRAFEYCPNLTTIRVPWAEGEVAGAPWGASNASVVYSYTSQ